MTNVTHSTLGRLRVVKSGVIEKLSCLYRSSPKAAEGANAFEPFARQLQIVEAILLFFCIMCRRRLYFVSKALAQGVGKAGEYVEAVTSLQPTDPHFVDFLIECC